MDSSSDSEDDVQRQQFQEAADPTLFTNAMYQTQPSEQKEQVSSQAEDVKPKASAKAKSQRYLIDDEDDAADLQLPESVRDHMYKKLTQLLADQIEFTTPSEAAAKLKTKSHKSRVKLLRGADCYLKTDDELAEVLTVQGPQVKPHIKKRQADAEAALSEDAKLRATAITVDDIKREVQCWAVKPERAHKVYHYRAADKQGGKLHAVERENEFSALRRRNKWSEEKIKRGFCKN